MKTWTGWILALSLAAGAAAASGGSSSLEIAGTVIDRLSRRPIPAARVVVDEAQLTVITDSLGRFRISLAGPGVYRFRASAPLYMASGWHLLEISASQPVQEVTLEIEPRTYRVPTVEIYGDRIPSQPPQTPTRALIASDIRRAPGGFQDPLRALQESRAIESRNDLGTLLTIRGGEPDQILFLVDGFDAYNPYRMRIVLGGGLSLANPDLIESVELYAGGFSARHGNRTTGLIHLRTRAGNRSHIRSRHSISLVAVSSALEGPLPRGKGSWILGLRRTYYDLILRPPEGDGNQYPYLQEAQGRLDWLISPKHKLIVRASASDEGIDLIARGEGESEDVQANGGSQIASGSLEQVSRLAGRIKLTTRLALLRDRSHVKILGIKGESLYTDAKSSALRFSSSHEWEITSPPHVTRFGIVWDRYRSKVDWLSDTQSSPSLNPVPDSLDIDGQLTYRAAYLEDTVALRKGWFLSAGIRIEDATGPSPVQFSPRVALRGELPRALRIRAGAGQFLQYPDGIQTFSREAPLWIESFGSLPPERASLFNLGLAADWSRFGWSLEAYTRDTRELLVPEDREIYRAVPEGRALARGLELELSWSARPRDDPERSWFESLDLTLAHAWGASRFRGGIFEHWTTVSAHRDHSFIGRLRLPLPGSLRFSSILRLASGAPYTPLLARVAWWDDDGEIHYRAVWGEAFSATTSPYGRLDLRVDREIRVFGRPGILFLEIINVTNRGNTLTMQWDNDLEERTPIHGLPLLPFLGLSF